MKAALGMNFKNMTIKEISQLMGAINRPGDIEEAVRELGSLIESLKILKSMLEGRKIIQEQDHLKRRKGLQVVKKEKE